MNPLISNEPVPTWRLLPIALLLVFRMARAAVVMSFRLRRLRPSVGDILRVEYNCDVDLSRVDKVFPRINESTKRQGSYPRDPR